MRRMSIIKRSRERLNQMSFERLYEPGYSPAREKELNNRLSFSSSLSPGSSKRSGRKHTRQILNNILLNKDTSSVREDDRGIVKLISK